MENEKTLQKTEKISNEILKEKEKEVTSYIISQINEKGYMKASQDYKYYIPMWFRDSSFTSISLTHNAKFLALEKDDENYRKAKNASARLLNFMWKAINKFSENMNRAIEIPFENCAFDIILNHVPARINENYSMGWHRNNKEMGSDNPLYYSDLNRSKWLKQYDSVPLLIIATNEYIKNFGIDENIEKSLHKISKLLPKMVEYMNKVYVAPCSNAWEMDTHQIHAYDVAAIYSGMENTIELVKYIKTNLKKDLVDNLKGLNKSLNKENFNKYIDKKNIHKLESCLGEIEIINNKKIQNIDENKILKYMNNINKFLEDHFIRNNIIYKAKDIFNENGDFNSNPIKEVDSEELFILNRFKPPCITKEIQDNTMQKIEEDLFNNNVLPIRFKEDKYFYGGRWPLLGLEAANWYIDNNKNEEAKKIINYITQKYLIINSKIVEQEIVNPASNYDPNEFYNKNNKKVIDDLAWSESAYVDTITKYLKIQEKKKEELIKTYERI